MTPEQLGFVALKLIERETRKRTLGDVFDLKRKLGTVAKEEGIPLTLLCEFADIMINKVFGEGIAEFRHSVGRYGTQDDCKDIEGFLADCRKEVW